MKKSLAITSIAAAIIILVSCKKPDTSDLKAPGKRELLTSRKWVLSSMNTRSSGGAVTPVPLTSCETDDYLLFDGYMNFKSDQGACISNTFAPQTDLGNWQTTDNFSSINLFSNGGSYTYYGTYIINELTESTLIFSDNNSSTVTQYNFKAQ
ncbi:MAG: hypothetical protein K0S53_2441 [Bacteroidetes bacterium]|jgi:hypothetical protein|nr:hypothetical protein [Bacteroidota bacterium]MDF2450879.1 hypothetical protein [Bacteroidota bacterium]